MSWRRWKLGLCIGLIMGLFDGGLVAFVNPIIGWKPLLFLILYFICKDGLNFLTKHPLETITSDTEIMKKPNGGAQTLLAVLGFALLTGCASYTTTQTDNSYVQTNVLRQITTKVTVRTFWSAKSDLAKSAVVNTDKSQSSRVGSLSQQATNDAANVVRIIIEKAP